MGLVLDTRRPEIARAQALLRDGALLLLYGPWPDEVGAVAMAAARSLQAVRIAHVDVAACSNDAQLSAALVRAAGDVLAGEAPLRHTPADAMSPPQMRALLQLRREIDGLADPLQDASYESDGISPAEVGAGVVRVLDSVHAVLLVDSADELLKGKRSRFHHADSLMWSLRAAAQGATSVRILLAGGPATGGLVQQGEQAFLGWGRSLHLERPAPERMATAIVEYSSTMPQAVAAEVARLAEGAPWVAGMILRRLRDDEHDVAAVHSAWDEVIATVSPSMRVALRAVSDLHRAAHAVCAALALGHAPYSAGSPSDVNRALRALERNAVVESPVPRRWELCDPLFAEWLRRRIAPM